MLQYTQDNDEKLPGPVTYNELGHDINLGHGWAGAIYPYIKSGGIYTCPSDSNKGIGNRVPVSYAFNTNLVYFGMRVGAMPITSTTQVPKAT